MHTKHDGMFKRAAVAGAVVLCLSGLLGSNAFAAPPEASELPPPVDVEAEWTKGVTGIDGGSEFGGAVGSLQDQAERLAEINRTAELARMMQALRELEEAAKAGDLIAALGGDPGRTMAEGEVAPLDIGQGGPSQGDCRSLLDCENWQDPRAGVKDNRGLTSSDSKWGQTRTSPDGSQHFYGSYTDEDGTHYTFKRTNSDGSTSEYRSSRDADGNKTSETIIIMEADRTGQYWHTEYDEEGEAAEERGHIVMGSKGGADDNAPEDDPAEPEEQPHPDQPVTSGPPICVVFTTTGLPCPETKEVNLDSLVQPGTEDVQDVDASGPNCDFGCVSQPDPSGDGDSPGLNGGGNSQVNPLREVVSGGGAPPNMDRVVLP